MMRVTITTLILLSLISCSSNKRKITKDYNDSKINATLVDGKFNGVVEQKFNDKNDWIKSISTNWENGDIKKIILTDKDNVEHDMKYHEKQSADNKRMTIFYQDENDSTFRTIPFNKDFLSFCADYTFLSTYNLYNLDSIIKIYNAPENSFRLASSPLPVNLENNKIIVINNGYKSDSLFITMYWIQHIKATEFGIKINKNAR